MEGMVMKNLFGGIYNNKRVLITGHTGFKGSWLALWLTKLGAEVAGYALDPPSSPSHYDLLNLPITSIIGDVRDLEKLSDTFAKFRPEIVFHMAAQPLVRHSYRDPRYTFETNIMGTVNVLETCRSTPSVKAIINITSDKCYENKEWVWGYRENDAMGGFDPYSASKGCSELVTSAYRNSFFHPEQYGQRHQVLVASVRAGNVVGGGDWAEDRLIPDIIRALSNKKKVIIRDPHAIRPWQHVLESLSGYLHLGQKLLQGEKEFAGAWNFGPRDEGATTVGEIVEQFKSFWVDMDYEIQQDDNNPHEAGLLKLDCSKAHIKLHWKSVWDSRTTIKRTVEWYREYYENNGVISLRDISAYVADAQIMNTEWVLS